MFIDIFECALSLYPTPSLHNTMFHQFATKDILVKLPNLHVLPADSNIMLIQLGGLCHVVLLRGVDNTILLQILRHMVRLKLVFFLYLVNGFLSKTSLSEQDREIPQR